MVANTSSVPVLMLAPLKSAQHPHPPRERRECPVGEPLGATCASCHAAPCGRALAGARIFCLTCSGPAEARGRVRGCSLACQLVTCRAQGSKTTSR